MSTKHKSINPDTIDFSATSLASYDRGETSALEPISISDSIEWNYKDGSPGPSLLVSTVLKLLNPRYISRMNQPHVMKSY